MNQETTLTALLVAAMLTGILHTLAGPDHYLPFIAISRSRRYNWFKTLMWTILCGIGHVGSAVLIALLFLLFAELLNGAPAQWFEEWRGNLAAYAMIGMGAAMLLHSLHRRWKHHASEHHHHHADGTVTTHTHAHGELHESDQLSYWVIFIIFVLGPCEALLPLLTASAVLGKMSVVAVTLVFSAATIVTMCAAVIAGCAGLRVLRIEFLERFAPEVAGVTVMLCGLAIVCLGL